MLGNVFSAVRQYFSYEPVSPQTPVSSYTIDGMKLTKLSEATKQNARDTETIHRQQALGERVSFAACSTIGALGAAKTVYDTGAAAVSMYNAGAFSWTGLIVSPWTTIGLLVGLPVAHKVAKYAIGQWAKAKEEPIKAEVRQRFLDAKQRAKDLQQQQEVVARQFVAATMATDVQQQDAHPKAE